MPLAAISRRVMVPELVFVTKANLLSGVISTQHGAPWVVGSLSSRVRTPVVELS